MHVLHRVLVNLYECMSLINLPPYKGEDYIKASAWRKNAIESAKSRAEVLTEDFINDVFDWRETETAGRWTCDYPENVILSSENLEKFVTELKRALEIQQSEIDHCLAEIKRKDICELVEAERRNTHGMESFYLLQLAELLYGKYTIDSGFYDTARYSAKITEETIEEVKKSPNDWALVFFDYHY